MPNPIALTITGSTDQRTFTGFALPNALIQILGRGALDIEDRLYADGLGAWSYTFPIPVSIVTISVLDATGSIIFIPDALTPTAISFSSDTAPGTVITSFEGLSFHETFVKIYPDDQVIVLGSDGKTLKRGDANPVFGSTLYTIATSLNRVLQTLVTVVSNPGSVVLNPLTVSNLSFLTNKPPGTIIGTVSGKTAGSSLVFAPEDGRVVLSGTNLVVGLNPSTAGTILGTLVETLAGVTRATNITLTAVSPITLNPLTVSNTSFVAGAAPGTIIGTVSGKTAGSSLVFSPNDGRVVVSGNNLVVGSGATAQGTVTGTLTETLAGAENSPRVTNVTITIGAPSLLLNTLTLSNASFTAGSAPGTVIGTISGLTAGSSLSYTQDQGRIDVQDDKLVVGSVMSTAGSFTFSLVETLNAAYNSPHFSIFTLTVNAVSLNNLTVSPLTATVGTPYSGTISGKTAGSTLSLSGSGAAGLSISNNTISGTPTAAGTVQVVETLANASNSPRTTNSALTVNAAPSNAILREDGAYYTREDGTHIQREAA